jgi:Flp pilus assembly protein TadG
MRKRKAGNQKGSVLVMVAFALIPLIGVTALAVDLGRAYMYRARLQNIADLASLAAVKAYANSDRTSPNSPVYVRDVVKQTAQMNPIPGQSGDATIIDADIITGTYDVNAKTFTNKAFSDVSVNAVQVSIEQGANGNLPLSFSFGRVLGVNEMNLEATSTSMVGERIIVLAVDMSSSMAYGRNENEGYKRLSRCLAPGIPPPYNDDARRYFSGPNALPQMAFDATACLGGLPQPAYDVFDISLPGLLNNEIFQSSYRLSFIDYGNDATVRVPMAFENKVQAQTEFTETVIYWDQLLAGGPAAFNAAKINVGGPNPPATGYTNIPDALEEAILQISLANVNLGSKSSNLIILISDGVPNCVKGYEPVCNNNAEYKTASKAADMELANQASAGGTTILAIYIGTPPPVCPEGMTQDDCDDLFNAWEAENNEGYSHMREVAEATPNGKAFFVSSVGEMNAVLQRTVLAKPPFVNVPVG